MSDFGLSRFSLVGQQSVRLVSLYKNCDFAFNQYSKVECCPYSGPIAIASLKESNDKCFIVKVFTSNGELLSQIETSQLYRMFWTVSQKLILLSKNGRVLIYTAKGKPVHHPFHMDKKTEILNICSAKVFHQLNSNNPVTGIACLKDTGQFFAVNNVENAILWRVPDISFRNAKPAVWTMLPYYNDPLLAWYTPRDGFKMVGQGKSSTSRTADWMRTRGEYTEMVTSVDLNSICLLHDSGLIQIVAFDLSNELYSIDISNINLNKNALKILWCKDSQVMLRTGQNKIMCLTQKGEPTEFPFHSEVHTCAEVDCLRVFDASTVDSILPISSAMRNVLSLDSKESGAYLYEATMKYKARDPMANDYVIQIGDKLGEAIKDCWAAALEAQILNEEANLFSAAVFGQNLQKTTLTGERIDFALHCKYLRILRFLRERGVPMSFAQFDAIGVDGVIDRLIEMEMYAAADIIAQQASPTASRRIVAHWAMDAIVNARDGFVDENELGDKIIERFAHQNNVSFAATAEVAYNKGLHKLADRLLDLEEDVVQQVTTLLRLKQQEKALKKSAKSKDPDLLFMVIRHLKASDTRDWELALQRMPHAFAMYKSITHDENPDRLISLYKQSDDFRRQALYHISSLPKLSLFDVDQLKDAITKSVEALDAANSPHLAQLMKQHKILIINNTHLEEQHGTSLLDKTLRETVIWAAVHQASLVDSLRKQYKLNEKQCWKWVIDGLSEAQEWERLEHFAREHKASSSGYLSLIKAFVKSGQKARALKFMDKISPTDQVAAYELIGEIRKAAEVLLAKQDVSQLFQFRSRYPPRTEEFKLINTYCVKAQAQLNG
ncbi:Vacuolar protein sorting-associated protein 16-like protein [Aphelenchoides bicaudatus]|nr:Vacuolar protein sorting-associated protein 16-like protein [Aphelenchoides bicaudatus]